MSRRILSAACLSLFALVAGASSAAPANAAEYGSFVLHNPSSADIHYVVAWSDGDVEYFTLEAYSQVAHYVALDSNGWMPGPTIKFDCLGGGDILTLTYDLDAYAVNDPSLGKDYSFEYSADGVFLDLYQGEG